MKISYLLNKDIVARDAVNLNYELNKFKKNTIYLVNESSNKRMINGKSLIGLLQGHFRAENNITIILEDISNIEEIKELFNNFGREINGG